MKIPTILNCLMLLLPLNALAHPGHEAAVAGQPGLFAFLLVLPGLAAAIAIGRFYRRRKTARADD